MYKYFSNQLTSLLLLIILYSINCSNNPTTLRQENDSDDPPIVIDPKNDNKNQKLLSLAEWNNSKEGFLDGSTFQVKVSSLKTNRNEALDEAVDVAKRKSLRLLQAESNPNLTNDGRVDLKIIIEEFGKIISATDFVGEKYHFIFQIKRPALEIIVKEKIK